MSEPLARVLQRAIPGDFTPAHPERPPWAQPTLRHVELASTGNVARVALERAGGVHLHGLKTAPRVQDWTEPTDGMPFTWGVTSAPRRQAPR